MCAIHLSVLSLVNRLAVSLHGNSRLATSTRLNFCHTLHLIHLVFLCNHGLHSPFLRAVCCPMARLATDVAVPRDSATVILLQPTRASLALETGVFLAILLRFIPPSTLALALARLVPSYLLGAAWLARATTATALLTLISVHKC